MMLVPAEGQNPHERTKNERSPFASFSRKASTFETVLWKSAIKR